jgi:cytochrome d ubiquinol oxidase subunit II
VAVAAYLSAVYLVWDARRLGETELVTYFRLRAVASAVVVAVIGVVSVFVLRSDARYLADGLTSQALPLVILSILSGVGALVLLARDATRGARLVAVVAVASLVVAWGVAQWPYLLPESLTVSAAAAPSGTLDAVMVAVVLAAVVVLPAFGLLFFLDQRSLLPEQRVDEATDSEVR